MDTFETHRPLLFSIAYRMLGSAMEAEDIVQDAYLRYQSVPPESIQSPKAFLGTVVTRLCLNQLESARAKRETYIGPWLPEPVLTGNATTTPANQVIAQESISMAFLVLLENLTPLERAVFLLREVFDYEYAEIAEIVGKEEAACRQLFSRARKHIAEHRPRFKASPEAHRQMIARFVEAANSGEMDGLLNLLADDVTLWTDGGGKARIGAATRPVHGRETVVTFLMASRRFVDVEASRLEIAEINGEPGIIVREYGKPVVVGTFEVSGGKIRVMRFIGNPDKLTRV
jgi:RNA polymerase sigma-70 factor (ECF subfamily)